ncbi:MAG: shikimate kinase [Planctomycetaceae bacterium]|nr:shikimate kinase [Planctomycetaceae bacterium]
MQRPATPTSIRLRLAVTPRNIVLIGMPGSGKSTVGRPLANQLGYAFLDTDHVIEAGEDKPLGDVLAGSGIDGFIDLESRYICGLHCERTVISTGGSVVYCDAAMRNLKELGAVVFLDVPLEVLEARLADLAGRGVVIAPGQSIAELERERRPYYEHYADFVVACSDEPAAEVARRTAVLWGR